MLGNLFGTQKVKSQPLQGESSLLNFSTARGSSISPQIRVDLSVFTHLDTRSQTVASHATQEALRLHKERIQTNQLLYGLLYDADLFQFLSSFSVDIGRLSADLQNKEQMGSFSGQPTLGEDTQKILESAYQNVKNEGKDFVAPEDILAVLYAIQDPSVKILEENGITRQKLEEKMKKSVTISSSKHSVLEQFGFDLTEQAKAGKLDPIAGREKEIERIIHVLLRRTKNNPIVIGEAGVGKTAIVEGLAQKIANGTAPKDLQGKKIIQLDLASLVAGASHRGEFEERLKSVINETITSAQIVLFIDEIHTLIGTGDTEGSLDASNIIKPYLARGQMQIIGTTTTSEYRKYFEKDKAFERRFQPIWCDEPAEEVAVEMLSVLKAKYEAFHRVVISEAAIKSAVHLSKKYIGERYLPDKAVDLLDEAAAQVKLANTEGKRSDTQLNTSDIEKVVSSWTGIPITKLTEDESVKLLHLEELIHRRLIDQQEAVSAISEAVRRGRIGLSSPNRPIASFIFLGPTGVGKTEAAKTLAEILFGRDDALIRLDMSEYMEKHEVAKLIGAPPGYVGYEEGGQLTEAVRRKPYSIVLLDEVEKAHPDVFNILLQILEDGRLTDNKGNTISFKNTIVIATSNIGSAVIQQVLTESSAESETERFTQMQRRVSDELHKFFRPELLNRFDDIVTFKPLSKIDMQQIAKLSIAKTEKLLFEQGFKLIVIPYALNILAKEGYDPVYGARPLRRLIQTAIENPISIKIIGKEFIAGDTIQIDYDDILKQFTFTKPVQPPLQPQVGQTLQNNQQNPPTPTIASNTSYSSQVSV